MLTPTATAAAELSAKRADGAAAPHVVHAEVLEEAVNHSGGLSASRSLLYPSLRSNKGARAAVSPSSFIRLLHEDLEQCEAAPNGSSKKEKSTV